MPSVLSIVTWDEKDCEQALAADLQCDQTKINVKLDLESIGSSLGID